MKDIKAMNGSVFVLPIRETKQVGGYDLISKTDEQDRYIKGEVIFACEHTPLEKGDVVLYDKSNGFKYQHDKDLLTVLGVGAIVGVV